MSTERGPLGELVVDGEPGEAFYGLLYRLSASALRARRGRPDDSEVRGLAHEVVLIPGLLDKLALLASDRELRAVLRTAVANYLVSTFRASHRGRVRRRVADVLDSGCPGLEPNLEWGVVGWGRSDPDDARLVQDADPERLSAGLPHLDIDWERWDSESGRDPIASPDELCRLIVAIVDVAGGSTPLWAIAEAVRMAAGLPDDGAILGWATERLEDVDTAAASGWVEVAAGEVLGVLLEETLDWLCALLDELPVRQLAAQTGIGKSTVARRLDAARNDVAQALDGYDAAGRVLLSIYATRCGTAVDGSAFPSSATGED